jgi:2'-5' RNA ligase
MRKIVNIHFNLFRFKNEVIWDKNKRLDNVYGSTGSNITISDVINKLDGVDYVKSQIDEEEVATVGRVKPQPNYFISIPISDKEICLNFDKLAKEIIESSPDAEQILVPSTSLHITLCTIRIDSDEDMLSVKKILEDANEDIKKFLPIEMKFQNFGMFFNKVLHIKCESDIEKLNGIKTLLLNELRKSNINLAGNYYDFTPHLTVLKINGKFLSNEANKGKSNLNNLIDIDLLEKYEDFEFGKQNVNELELCKMVNIFSQQKYPVEFKLSLND